MLIVLRLVPGKLNPTFRLLLKNEGRGAEEFESIELRKVRPSLIMRCE